MLTRQNLIDALAECETYRDTLLGQRQDQAVEIDRLRAALAAAGDLLFDLWDGDTEMLARYESVNNQITRALKVGAGETATNEAV